MIGCYLVTEGPMGTARSRHLPSRFTQRDLADPGCLTVADIATQVEAGARERHRGCCGLQERLAA